ncbi:MAG: hypothetical protein JWP64_1741 [Pseudonocardia sp.]|nr:hypothetical protein [Pseudonocardia sp.]
MKYYRTQATPPRPDLPLRPPRPLEHAESLTDPDRAELTRRQAKAAYWAEVSARQRAAHGMDGW